MVILSPTTFNKLADICHNPPAPTNCELYWKDCQEKGHSYYLSTPTHIMWKAISKIIDKAWYALIDPNLLSELFYDILQKYFSEENLKNPFYDENFSFRYFEYHPEKIDDTPTDILFSQLVQEIDNIIKIAKYDGVRAPVIEDAYFSEMFDRFYF